MFDLSLAGIGKDMCHVHKATEWLITKVPTGPAICPSRETAGKIYTILWKDNFSFVKFSE